MFFLPGIFLTFILIMVIVYAGAALLAVAAVVGVFLWVIGAVTRLVKR